MWFSKSHFKPSGKTAVIVGASQGLGTELALKLYEQNCSVILIARTTANLQKQISRIEATVCKPATATLSYISGDVSKYSEAARMWDEIFDSNVDPDYIFCCAGSSIPKLFDDLTSDELAGGIGINYGTALNFVHSGFKKIKSANSTTLYKDYKPRHVIFFSSVLAFYPFIGYAQYAPMKSALMSLSVILRQELGPYNFRVSCAFPGNFQSEGYDQEELTKPKITKTIEGASDAITAAECADLILDKLGKGYDTITTDFIGWVLGCSVLGVLPRTWSVFQILVSLIFLMVAPIGNWVVYRDVLKFFESAASHQSSVGDNSIGDRVSEDIDGVTSGVDSRSDATTNRKPSN